MKRSMVVVGVGAAMVLALPGRALALDHLALYVAPGRPAAQPGQLSGWRLSATVYEAFPGLDSVRVGLARSFRQGRAGEAHNFYGGPPSGLSFDGARGTWVRRFGTTLAVRMAIVATGMPRPVGANVACRGEFQQVPVALRGTLALRTGTRFFRTVRRTRASGTVVFHSTGRVDCSPAPPATGTCEPASTLFLHQNGPARTGGISVTSAAGGETVLAFGDVPGPQWYHVMTLSGFNPLAGSAPTLGVEMPAGSPIQGGGTFTAGATSEQTASGCRTVTASGAFEGSFRARFAGWGARTLRVVPSDSATYSSTGP
jgi:hypothetical protein